MMSRSHMLQAFAAASQESSTPSHLGGGQAVRKEGDIVRRRAADAWRNSPLIHNGTRTYRRGLLGSINAVWSDERAQEAWDAWAQNCGYRHNHGSLPSILGRVAHHLAQDGEVFLHRVVVEVEPDIHPNGLLLQVWPARLRDRTNRPGSDVVDGIEFENGLPSAVYFKARTSSPESLAVRSVRVPFSELVWLRYAPEGDQLDGLAPSHAAIESDAQLSDYAQTALVQQRVASCAAAVIMADSPPFLFSKQMELGPRVTDSEGNAVELMEPGTFPIVHGAKGITSITPEMSPFPVREHTARVAAGQGLAAETISGQVGQASFSALRHALLTQEEVIAEFALLCGWSTLTKRLEQWFRREELLAGRSWESATLDWLSRRRESIDPVKTVVAEGREIELGLKSKQQAVRERGRRWADVQREIQEERDATQANPAEGTGTAASTRSNERHLALCR